MGWSQVIPSQMPSENVIIEAYWLKETIQFDETLNVGAGGLSSSISPELIENKEVEIIFNVELKEAVEVDPSDTQMVSDLIKRSESARFIDIKLILRVQGESDVLVSNLTQPVRITIAIPQDDLGHTNYRVIRIHSGILDILETEHDEENNTLTFETDRFSTYSIIYDTSSGSWAWWLLIILLIPLGYFGYRYHSVVLEYLKKVKKEDLAKK
jgi:hypothetical protein